MLDSHEAGGYFSCPEYQWAITQFYRRHLCRQEREAYIRVVDEFLTRTEARSGA